MKRYNLYIPDNVMEALRALADDQATTYSALMRRILIAYLKHNGRLPK